MSLQKLANDDKPREKFLLKGKESLSDSELLAIILGSGNKEQNALELARSIFQSVDNDWNRLSRLTIKDLMKFKGIGEVKSIEIMTALEIGKRKAMQTIISKPQISSSQSVYDLIKYDLQDACTEEFWCLYLNNNNRVLHKQKLAFGGITDSIIDVRVLFKMALENYATAIVVAHNHPSGSLKPSNADMKITEKIKNAGQILNINLLDHLIITSTSYISFADENLL